MKKILFFVLAAISLLGCEKGFVETEPQDKYSGDSKPILTFLKENGLKPSMPDSINRIPTLIQNENYQLLFGTRCNQAWISKLDKNGEELFCYQLDPMKGWDYSEYRRIILKKNNLIVLQVTYYINNNPKRNEFYSIFDIEKNKHIDSSKPMTYDAGSTTYFVDYFASNSRVLILQHLNQAPNLSVVGESGNILYQREYDEKIEGLYLSSGIIFIDDEIVAPMISKSKHDYVYRNDGYAIVNLRDWSLKKKIKWEDLIYKGDRYGDKNISYDMDTTILEGNNIKYIYSEIKEEIDEITGKISSTSVLDRYYYNINTSSYELSGPFKYN